MSPMTLHLRRRWSPGIPAVVAAIVLAAASVSACDGAVGVEVRTPRVEFVRTPYDTLFVSDPASGEVEQRIALPSAALRVAAAPTGDHLAVITASGLWVMNVDGSGAYRIATDVAKFGNVAWTADGKRLAYIRSLPSELHLIGVDGSGDVTVPGVVPGGFAGLAWSPDGRRIAFEGYRPMTAVSPRTVYVVNTDGSGLLDVDRPLAGASGDEAGEPTFSPDGKRLAFERSIWVGGTLEMKLWVLRLGTTDARQITAGDGDDVRPSWSPDGEDIVFLRFHGDNADVWMVRADGSGLHQLTDTPEREEYPGFLMRR